MGRHASYAENPNRDPVHISAEGKLHYISQYFPEDKKATWQKVKEGAIHIHATFGKWIILQPKKELANLSARASAAIEDVRLDSRIHIDFAGHAPNDSTLLEMENGTGRAGLPGIHSADEC